jgi:hypothetical protein
MSGATRPTSRRPASTAPPRRVLHLDRDVVTVARARTVNLARRGDGERLLVDGGEQLPDAGIEVPLDDTWHPPEGECSRAVGQRTERGARPPALGGRSSWTSERNCLIFGPAPFSRPSRAASSSATARARASSREFDRSPPSGLAMCCPQPIDRRPAAGLVGRQGRPAAAGLGEAPTAR